MQIRLGKGYDFVSGEYDEQKLKKVQEYYNIMAYFDKANLAYYYYLQAESFYSVAQYKMANQQYKVSLETYKKTPSKEDIRLKVIDSLFSSLDKGNYAKDYLNEHLIYAYENYIAFWPTDSKANTIYEKLVNLLINENKIEIAENYLVDYTKNFKASIITQQALAERILDSHIKNKNTVKLANWINSTQKGYLNFQASRILKLEEILAQILFKGLHQLNKKNNYLQAIAGYTQVFQDKNFSNKVKSEAAHHISTVHSFMANHNKAIDWLKISLSFADKKEISERKKTYFNSYDRFILLQNLEGAMVWSDFILNQYCEDKDALNDNTIEKNFHILKAIADLKGLQNYRTKYSKCSKKVDWLKLEKDKLNYFYVNNFWDELSDFYYDNEKTEVYKDELINLFSIIFETSLNKNDSKWLDNSKKILTRLNCTECLEKVLALKEFQKYKNEINKFWDDSITFGEQFDEKDFNTKFTQRLERAKKLFTQGDHILKYKFYYTSLQTLQELNLLTEQFGLEILNLNPPIVEVEYLSSFKAQMKGVSASFLSKSKEYKLKASYLIQDQKLFLEDRKLVSLSSDILSISNILIPAKHYVLTVHSERGKNE